MKTKLEKIKFAKDRGCNSSYSGKLKRFFFKRIPFITIDVHGLINSK